jgi:hypothetical protein
MAITGTNDTVTWLTSAADTISGDLYIEKVVWSGIGTGGDDLKLMDASSNEQIFLGKAGQYDTIELTFDGPRGRHFNGVKVTTIDSGQVGIYKK